MKGKISIIGAGQVGATAAHIILQKGFADIVLLDIAEGLSQGKALDLGQSGVVERYDSSIIGTNDYNDVEGSDIVFITAGLARKPGMDRLDLLKKNAAIIKDVVQNITSRCPHCVIIMMTNPVDILTYLAWKISGFPHRRVLGQAGALDTARFSYFISEELGVPAKDIKTVVLGGHGDTMVPLPGLTTVKGKKITELLTDARLAGLIQRTRRGGAEIVSLLKTGSAYYAPAAAAVSMMESIMFDKKEIMPVSVYAEGEYGIKDVYIGLPVMLGEHGAEQIIELDLSPAELSSLQKSALVYKNGIDDLKEYTNN